MRETGQAASSHLSPATPNPRVDLGRQNPDPIKTPRSGRSLRIDQLN
jgi:hypothetical protein